MATTTTLSAILPKFGRRVGAYIGSFTTTTAIAANTSVVSTELTDLGFTDDDVRKWGWRISEQGWVNYPDYQSRVFRNKKDIRWRRPLHEYISGCETFSHLPPHEALSLYHPKTKEKQEQQNQFYMDNFSRGLLVR